MATVKKPEVVKVAVEAEPMLTLDSIKRVPAVTPKPAIKVQPRVVKAPIVEPVVKTEAPVDPWTQMRTVYILPEGYGEIKSLPFAVNGVKRNLKVGEPELVPEPIAKRVDIYNEAIKARQKMYANLRAETAKNARFL